MLRKRKTIAIIILLIGLLLVFSPFIKNWIVEYLSTHHKIGQFSAEELERNNQKKATFDYSSVEPPSVTNVLKGAKDYNKDAVIGNIAIPSVDINLLTFKGTNNANLLAGATTMLEDQTLGKGNYPLAGHHMRKQSMLFGPLMNIKKGAKVYITDLKKIYQYEIEQTKIIKDTNVSVLDQTTEPTITLITCDKPTETNKRFIATGKLIKTETLTKELKNKYFNS
ncbi:class A sortase [Listeria sp. PSOL-1]|uniref:class A sortase n=1 Tax=Listeria sp. PSOL-1 TaxID=1844999 RepID=UPI0013D735F6|nr:class A sortase [Listeria sp. PSOL-1]